MEQEELQKVVETLLFITDQPLSLGRLGQITGVKDADLIKETVAGLQKHYGERNCGIQILEAGGGFQMATKPEFSSWIRKLFHDKLAARLSAAGLETLAIISYKQPITRAEIETIRGVEVIGPLETLLERRLIKVVGRKETVGRPLLYGTTTEFLRQFGINDISDLPIFEDAGLVTGSPAEPQAGGQPQAQAAPSENAGAQHTAELSPDQPAQAEAVAVQPLIPDSPALSAESSEPRQEPVPASDAVPALKSKIPFP